VIVKPVVVDESFHRKGYIKKTINAGEGLVFKYTNRFTDGRLKGVSGAGLNLVKSRSY
jgi:hypothetical protein